MIKQDLKERAKSAYEKYQLTFWHVGILKNELLKPLGFWNETLLIVTALKVYGVEVGKLEILLWYIGVVAVAAVGGKLFVMTGVLQYMNRVGNKQNPEFIKMTEQLDQIHRDMQEIKQALKL